MREEKVGTRRVLGLEWERRCGGATLGVAHLPDPAGLSENNYFEDPASQCPGQPLCLGKDDSEVRIDFTIDNPQLERVRELLHRESGSCQILPISGQS